MCAGSPQQPAAARQGLFAVSALAKNGSARPQPNGGAPAPFMDGHHNSTTSDNPALEGNTSPAATPQLNGGTPAPDANGVLTVISARSDSPVPGDTNAEMAALQAQVHAWIYTQPMHMWVHLSMRCLHTC